MPIQYVCLGCREEMVLPDHKAGQLCACPRCRLKFLAPPPTAGRAAPPRAAPTHPAPAPAGRPVRLVAPPTTTGHGTPPPQDEDASAAEASPGLFGMDASAMPRGGLFGQADVQVGALFGGAAADEDEATGADEEVDDDTPTEDAEPTPASVQRPGIPGPVGHARPPAPYAQPAAGPAPLPPGYRPGAPGAPLPGYGYPPPAGYPTPGAPPPGYPAHPQHPHPQHAYPPPPPGYGAPPGYPPGYPVYPGYPPAPGYPAYGAPGVYPGYPGYAPAPGPTPPGGVPIAGPPPVGAVPPGAPMPPPASPDALDAGRGPDLISMDDLYARKAPAAPVAAGRGCRLVCLDGLPEGTEFHLPAGKIYDIGRDKEADVKILSTSVSRRQARIDATGSQPVLIDCGSANGTQVNGEVVARHPLREGDLIKMGKVLFRFQSA